MNSFLSKVHKDFYAGGLMALFGLGAIKQGFAYRIGTLGKMGPGFLPVALGIVLLLIGLILMRRAGNGPATAGKQRRAPEWKGWLCICAGIASFIVLGKYGGLVPATFALVFISAMGDRDNTVKRALVLAAVMVAIAITIFWWALSLSFPLFQWG
jgi:hypothetical protein